MQAKEISTFILCVSLAITAISQTGIFNTDSVGNIDIPEINESLTTGISEIDSNATASEDIGDTMSGTAMLLQTFGTFKTMLGLIFLPYAYLVSIGVPAYFALPVQIVFNVTFVWAIIQFLSGRSTKTLD
jgi:hypothetical protein